MAFGRRKNKLSAEALYRAGRIIVRSEEFWRRVYMFMLSDADGSLLQDRIIACIPKGIPITTLRATTGETYFTTDSWQAKLVNVQNASGNSTYEFWFSDPKSDTDMQALLQMNVLITAVEKAFLLTSPYTVIDMRYATSDARDFTIGAKGQSSTAVFTIGQWVNLGLSAASPAVALKAIKAGSDAIHELHDVSQTAALNEMLTSLGGTGGLLLAYFDGVPALPPSLEREAADILHGQPQPSSATPAQTDPAAGTGAAPRNGEQFSPSAETMQYTTSEYFRADTRYCSRCGTPAGINSRFCRNCGQPLRREEHRP